MTTVLINPFNETELEPAAPAGRLAGLEGCKIALLDISKPGGSVFLDRIERLLGERYRVASVVRFVKPTFTKPAPAEVIQAIAASGCDGLIEALAD